MTARNALLARIFGDLEGAAPPRAWVAPSGMADASPRSVVGGVDRAIAVAVGAVRG